MNPNDKEKISNALHKAEMNVLKLYSTIPKELAVQLELESLMSEIMGNLSETKQTLYN